MRKQWKQWQTIFLGSKITADGDCSHEIKRHLLLGRKAMTSLDSILKSRHYSTNKGLSSQSYVFPIVMYGCESWTIKEVEQQKTDVLNCAVNPKGNQSWIFTGRTNAEAESPIFWPSDQKSHLIGKNPDAGKDWGQEEKVATEDETVEWHHQFNGREFKQIRRLWRATAHGVAKSQTRLSDWTTTESD